MNEDEKAEAAAPTLDPRAAEVLRSLDRAKGTIAKTQTGPNIEATAESLESTARVIEAVVTVAREMLADFQRGQDRAVSELRVSVDALRRQADMLAAWRAWWMRQVATWALALALVLAAGIGLAWRAHALAKSTHDILQQILENQTKAQAPKGGKRR
jgi:Na+(H+)/acetate symporter ActP